MPTKRVAKKVGKSRTNTDTAKKGDAVQHERVELLAELGLTKEEIVPVFEAYKASSAARILREQAVASLCDVLTDVIRPLAGLLRSHSEIINESFGLAFKKSRNDLKSKLGQPAKAGAAPTGKGFTNGRERPVTAPAGREVKDKKPLTTNLGDKMRAAGVMVDESEAPMQTH